MKAVASLLFLVLPVVAVAQPAFSLRPGFREPVNPRALTTNPFVGPVDAMVVQEVDTGVAEPAGVRDLRAFIAAHPISGIAWAPQTESRSVLLGSDIVLRIGSSIPRDYLDVGPSFTVADIQQNVVTFVPLGRSDYPINFQAHLRTELKNSLSRAAAAPATGSSKSDDRKFWLLEGKRHNSTCSRFYNQGEGRAVNKNEGKPCELCGG